MEAAGIRCGTSAAAVFWEGHPFVPRSGRTPRWKTMAFLAEPQGVGLAVQSRSGPVLACLAQGTDVLTRAVCFFM